MTTIIVASVLSVVFVVSSLLIAGSTGMIVFSLYNAIVVEFVYTFSYVVVMMVCLYACISVIV
jgi:hypothetical protein